MKVLFVDTPPTLDWSPASRFTKGGRRFPALSVTGEITYSYLNLQAAAILRDAGCEVAYIDCQAEGLGFDELVVKVEAHAPDLLVMYVEQIKIHVDKELAARAKERTGARVGFVGPFVTPLGTQVVRETPAVDFALRGEYDESLREVARSLAAGTDEWTRVEGISVRDPDTGEIREVGVHQLHPGRTLVVGGVSAAAATILLTTLFDTERGKEGSDGSGGPDEALIPLIQIRW